MEVVADTLFGGLGRDIMEGGSGADVFIFKAVNESCANANSDVIINLENGADLIDLSALSAGVAGSVFFQVVQGDAISGLVGELQVIHNAGLNRDTVKIDLDGDAIADMRFFVQTSTVLNASEFLFDVAPSLDE